VTEKQVKKIKVIDKPATDSKLIDFLVESVRKDFGRDSIMSMKDTNNKIKPLTKTGYTYLDTALGIGGLPGGRIIEIFGPETSGKTTLTLHIAAEFQKIGGTVAFIDVENALDVNYARGLGVDVESLLLNQPDNGEQVFDIIETLSKSVSIFNSTNGKQKKPLLVIVDSVAAMSPKAELEGTLEDGTGAGMGSHARLMSLGLRRLVSVVRDPNILIIFINQTRNKIGGYGNPETTTGGCALKFYASIRIQIKSHGKYEESKEQVGKEFTIKIVKNKVSPPFTECTGLIRFGVGIDKVYPIFNELLKRGEIIKGGKGWLKLNKHDDLEQFIGFKGFRTFYANNKELVDKIYNSDFDKSKLIDVELDEIDE
jgi:recombination protein RecA